MSVEVKEVTSIHQLKTFIRFPLSLYKGSPYYVPSLYADELNTLRSDRNPAFQEAKARYWLAYKDGKLAGRVAAMIVPKHELKWGEKFMRFGWLDFIDDPEVVSALMGKVEDWAKEEGKVGIHGPLGFTDLDREGMLVDGFAEVATLATLYNYPYYPERLTELGYTKDVDWIEHEFIVSDQPVERFNRLADLITKRYNLHMFNGKKKDLLKIAPQLFDVLNEAYRDLYGTVPLSESQIQSYINTYFGFVLLDYIPIVLDENEKIVAFGITFPSFSKALMKTNGNLFPFGFIHFLLALWKNDRADFYLVGVRDKYRRSGITVLLALQILSTFKKHGIKYAESNPNLETNQDILAMWKYLEHRQHKRRRVFVKHLN